MRLASATVVCSKPGLRANYFFFNDTATTEIYTLSLHDALPIFYGAVQGVIDRRGVHHELTNINARSEEHTSELQSRQYLVCRLLLEKKKERAQRWDHTVRGGAAGIAGTSAVQR